MLATPGDLIAVRGFGHVRKGTVVEARKGVEREMLLVRWEDGHTSLFIPGSSTTVEHPRHDGDKSTEVSGPGWLR